MRDSAAELGGSSDFEKPARAANGATSPHGSGKSDPDSDYDFQHHHSCFSPFKNEFSADEYLTLGLAPTNEIFEDVSEIVRALERQSSFYEDTTSTYERRPSSSVYSSDRSYSELLSNPDSTVVVKGQPLVEEIIANNKRTLVPTTGEDPPNHKRKPDLLRASNFQDGSIVIHTNYGCSCQPKFRLFADLQRDNAFIHTKSCSQTTSSVDEDENNYLEMKIPRKSVASSSSNSSSKSNQTNALTRNADGSSLDKSASSLSRATTALGVKPEIGMSNDDRQPMLIEDMRCQTAAKVPKAPLLSYHSVFSSHHTSMTVSLTLR